MDTKIHRAELGGYSSVVGQPIMLLNKDGACIGQLAVLNVQGDYKEMVAQVAEVFTTPNRHAYKVGQAVGKAAMTDPIALIRAALEEAARVADDHYAKCDMGNPGHWISAIDPHAILRRVQEGQHGQG